MLIQGTKKFLDAIGVKPSELAAPDTHLELPNSFMAWHANVIPIGRRKMIVLVNNESRYPIIIYGAVKKDYTNIKKLIPEAIRDAWRVEGIHEDVIDAYIKKAGDITFAKTANRSMTARMTRIIEDMHAVTHYIDQNTKFQRYLSMMTGRFMQLAGSKEGLYPIERTLECLQEINEEEGLSLDVLDIDLYQLKIAINIEGHDIWRRVKIPSTFSFRQLHHLIQNVYDWHNSHIHEFTVRRQEEKPLKIIMEDSSALLDMINTEEYDVQVEISLALEDIFQETEEICYVYDFGDNWEHTVILEKVEKADKLVASYVDGAGERPPEDIGGAPGFEQYLQIMANKNHPDHEHMNLWAKYQREDPHHLKQIRSRLKGVLSNYVHFQM